MHLNLQEKGESEHDFGLRAARAIEIAILEAGAENVAAFIGEPIMGAGGRQNSRRQAIGRKCSAFAASMMCC